MLTQKLIMQPYLETEIFAQDVRKLEVESGISDFEVGVMTRYEITRKFAPYVAFRYHTKTFGTANLAKKLGQRVDNFIAVAEILKWFIQKNSNKKAPPKKILREPNYI